MAELGPDSYFAVIEPNADDMSALVDRGSRPGVLGLNDLAESHYDRTVGQCPANTDGTCRLAAAANGTVGEDGSTQRIEVQCVRCLNPDGPGLAEQLAGRICTRIDAIAAAHRVMLAAEKRAVQARTHFMQS